MRWPALALKAAVTVGLIVWVFARTDFEPVLARMGEISPAPLVLVAAAIIIQYAFFATRWWLVARAIEAISGWVAALRYTAVSLFFNQALVSTVGGDAVRVWLVHRDGVTLGRAVSGVVLDRTMALLALVLLVLLTLPLSLSAIGDPALAGGLAALAGAGTAAFAGLVVAGRPTQRLFERWRPTRPLARMLSDVFALFARRDVFAIALGLSAINHLLSGAIAVLLARAMDVPLGVVDGVTLFLPIILAASLPISIGGWGVREGAMVVVLGEIGVAGSDALALSLIYGFTYLASGIVGGVAWFTDTRRSEILRRGLGAGEGGRA